MSSFEIADCPTRLPITEKAEGNQRVQQGTLTVTLRNKTERARTARVTVETEGAAKPNWFSFEGSLPTNPRELEHDLGAKGTATIRLNLSVPVGEAPGSHVARIRVTAEDDPDEDFTIGPNVAFDLVAPKEAPPPQREKFPWWAIAVAAALVLLVVGGGAAMFLLRGNDDEVSVPRLIGMTESTALRRLRSARLGSTRALVIVGGVGTASGRVILTEPPAGERVARGSKIKLFIGAATNLFKCPDGRQCVFFINLPAETQKLMKANMATIK